MRMGVRISAHSNSQLSPVQATTFSINTPQVKPITRAYTHLNVSSVIGSHNESLHSLDHAMEQAKNAVASTRRLRPNTKISALLFFICALGFVIFGAIAVATAEISSNVFCLATERAYHNIVAHVMVGSQLRRLRLLVRVDMVVECDNTAQPSMLLFDQHSITSSASARCQDNLCFDAVSVRMGGKSEVMAAAFFYGANRAQDYVSYNLELDGELYLCRGYDYTFDDREMCWDEHDSTGSNSVDTNEVTLEMMPTTSSTMKALQTKRCNLMNAPLLNTPIATAGICGPEDPILDESYDCSSASDVVIWSPSFSYRMVSIVGLSEQNLYELMSDSTRLDSHLTVAMLGRDCAQSSNDPIVKAAWDMFDTLCTAASIVDSSSGCNRNGFVLPYSVISRLSFVYKIPPRGEYLRVRLKNNEALRSQAMPGAFQVEQGWSNATWPSVRLLIMILAAAVVYIRQEEAMEKNDRLFVGCIRMVMHSRASDTSNIKNAKRVADALSIERQSGVLGLIAVFARIVVTCALARVMWHARLYRVVILQLACSIASLVHWIVIHSYAGTIVRQMSLGGSSAIIDITAATLLAYSTPPVRADVDDFNTIARLLTSMLIAITCPTRCFFSSACAGIVLGAESVFGACFWFLQSITIAFSIVDLFALPTAIDMMRSIPGEARWAAFAIFALTASICGPRLTANAIAISKAAEDLSH